MVGKFSKQNIYTILLSTGVLASALYLITDIIACSNYPGYNFYDQAVSELFAIGAPTSYIVVPLFSISSILYILLAIGVYLTNRINNYYKVLALLILLNAINCLILWNIFPMHMRNAEKDATDMWHTILAINPFIFASILMMSIKSSKIFRIYSIITISILLVMAGISFSFVTPLINGERTAGMGLTERIAQYAHQTWHASLGIYFIMVKSKGQPF